MNSSSGPAPNWPGTCSPGVRAAGNARYRSSLMMTRSMRPELPTNDEANQRRAENVARCCAELGYRYLIVGASFLFMVLVTRKIIDMERLGPAEEPEDAAGDEVGGPNGAHSAP